LPVLERVFAEIDVKPGAKEETQSGIQMMRPRIYGLLEREPGAKAGVIIMHPASNFMNHHMVRALSERGIACMGLNNRYVNNDSVLLMERAIQDLGAGVKWLRDQGCNKVVLLGYSGGAALSAFYQAQAEKLTVQATPAGDPVPLVPGDLPPVDGLVFCAAHAGRSRLLLEWIDPSVTDENDAASRDPSLDMYDPANGVPYSSTFLSHYRAGQLKRRDKIESWVWERLRALRAAPGGATDQAFVVHRTFADPRFQDTTIDPSDRKPGGMWGNAKGVNYASNAIGRYTSLTAFLSQWASVSKADGPDNAAKTSCPALYVDFTADEASFPSTRDLWLKELGKRAAFHAVKGADHYIKGRPELLAEAGDVIANWVKRL
jgi:pimeloyl-ACP methyl ester carboxylesterase